MDTNNSDYVLVLEDRIAVKNEQEIGKLSVVSDIDDTGKLKTNEARAVNQASFLKQFNDPTRFGLYKVVASNVEQGVEHLRASLQNRPRFFKYNPDKKQDSSKVEVIAEEYKTQVAVNNQGKTNEATKHLKEPLKSGQTQPTAEQKQKQENKQRRGRKM